MRENTSLEHAQLGRTRSALLVRAESTRHGRDLLAAVHARHAGPVSIHPALAPAPEIGYVLPVHVESISRGLVTTIAVGAQRVRLVSTNRDLVPVPKIVYAQRAFRLVARERTSPERVLLHRTECATAAVVGSSKPGQAQVGAHVARAAPLANMRLRHVPAFVIVHVRVVRVVI